MACDVSPVAMFKNCPTIRTISPTRKTKGGQLANAEKARKSRHGGCAIKWVLLCIAEWGQTLTIADRADSEEDEKFQ